ncbi:hypothetical protein PIB30_024531 [Stylosanthes scabra]|uniref:Uncharacterized protein n=1 Tax=Stylosanthes scabra TaxID=79078 RepID=A0ABU6QA21_9FABA|nr:hypothetical protein [Stylosanthes scabra]
MAYVAETGSVLSQWCPKWTRYNFAMSNGCLYPISNSVSSSTFEDYHGRTAPRLALKTNLPATSAMLPFFCQRGMRVQLGCLPPVICLCFSGPPCLCRHYLDAPGAVSDDGSGHALRSDEKWPRKLVKHFFRSPDLSLFLHLQTSVQKEAASEEIIGGRETGVNLKYNLILTRYKQ